MVNVYVNVLVQYVDLFLAITGQILVYTCVCVSAVCMVIELCFM